MYVALVTVQHLVLIILLSMSSAAYITQAEKEDNNAESSELLPQQITLEDLDSVSLRNLREKKKQTDRAIEAVQARINYMKVKEETALKKVFNVRKRVSDIERVRKTSAELKQMQQAANQRMVEELERKNEFNKLLREHLDCNKKIVYTIMNEKIREEARKLKIRKQELEIASQTLRDSSLQQNFQRANQVRQDHLHLQEKKRLHFLEKLRNFKEVKEDQLRLEMRVREQHQARIQELQQKEAVLLDRFNMSEKFKQKCQEEYKKAKEKYHSFYENAIIASRRQSLRQTKYSTTVRQTRTNDLSVDSKCNIFIS